MKVPKPGHFVMEKGDMEKANDSWAQVELFRWQYGELPRPNDERRIDVGIALTMAAKACRERQIDPFNAASMLQYAGKLLEGKIL